MTDYTKFVKLKTIPLEEDVDQVAVSPSNNRIAVVTNDGYVSVFDTMTGAEVAYFGDGEVRTIAYNPDGTEILTGYGDKALVFNPTNGAAITTTLFQGAPADLSHVAYDPARQKIAMTVDGSNDIYIYSQDTQTIKKLSGHTGPINSITFGPNGILVSGSQDKKVILWLDLTNDSQKLSYKMTSPVKCVAYSPKNDEVAWGTANGVIRLFSQETGKIHKLKHGDSIRNLIYSPDGTKLISADLGKIVIWNVKTRKKVKEFQGNIFDVGISPDGKQIYIGGVKSLTVLGDPNAILGQPVVAAPIDYTKFQVLKDIDIGDDTASLDINTSGTSMIYCSSETDLVKRVDFSKPNDIQTLPVPDSELVDTVVYVSDNIFAAAYTAEDKIKLFNHENGEELATIPEAVTKGSSVVFSPDGKKLAALKGDNSINIWNVSLDTLSTLHTSLVGHEEDVLCTVFNSSGTRLLTGSQDNTVRLWDTDSGKQLKELIFRSPISAISFNRDETKFICGDDVGDIHVIHADGSKVIHGTHEFSGENRTSVLMVAFGANNTAISGDRKLYVWQEIDGKMEVIKAINTKAQHTVVRPNGMRLVTIDWYDKIKIWGIPSTEEVQSGQLPPQPEIIYEAQPAQNNPGIAQNSPEQLNFASLLDALVANKLGVATLIWNANPFIKPLMTARSIPIYNKTFKMVTFVNNKKNLSDEAVVWLIARGLDPFQPLELWETDEEFTNRRTKEVKAQNPGANEQTIAMHIFDELGRAKAGRSLFSETKDETRRAIYANQVNIVLEQFLKELQFYVLTLITDQSQRESVCKNVQNKVLWNMEQFIGNKLIQVPTTLFDHERLAALKVAIYSTLDDLKRVCDSPNAPIPTYLIGQDQSGCYDISDPEGRIVFQFHFRGYPRRPRACVTLNTLLLGSYGGNEGEFRGWFDEDIPDNYKQQLESIRLAAIKRGLMARWTKDPANKELKRVLETGDGAIPDLSRQFIEFDVSAGEMIQGESNRVAITLQSWIDLVSQISGAIAAGIKVFHVCMYLVGGWRSGNVKGTAMSGENHAQEDTGVRSVYYAALCLPEGAPITQAHRASGLMEVSGASNASGAMEGSQKRLRRSAALSASPAVSPARSAYEKEIRAINAKIEQATEDADLRSLRELKTQLFQTKMNEAKRTNNVQLIKELEIENVTRQLDAARQAGNRQLIVELTRQRAALQP